MRFGWINLLLQGSAICLVLAILGLVLIVFAPFLAFLPTGSINGVAPTIAFMLLIASAALFQIYIILTVVEIATSGNETSWKLVWGAICFFGGVVGMIFYNFIAKKDLKWVN